jgi:hypothetical protein
VIAEDERRHLGTHRIAIHLEEDILLLLAEPSATQ